MRLARSLALGLCAAYLAGCSSTANFEGPAAYEKAPMQEKINRIKNAALSPAQKAQAIDNLGISAEEKEKLKAEVANSSTTALPMGQPPRGG